MAPMQHSFFCEITTYCSHKPYTSSIWLSMIDHSFCRIHVCLFATLFLYFYICLSARPCSMFTSASLFLYFYICLSVPLVCVHLSLFLLAVKVVLNPNTTNKPLSLSILSIYLSIYDFYTTC